jgi:hypothetical protein
MTDWDEPPTDWDQPPKYEVYKVEDGTVVDDAVVIRLKDPFAATALHTYASTILSFMDLMRNVSALSKEEERRLLSIVDYFQQKGDESALIKGKRLPD